MCILTFYVQCICLCISVFIPFYIRPLFAVFNIHTIYKMLYEFKIHYKKNISMYKILFKSKFNTSRFLQNVYAYNQIDRACRYRNQTGRNTICMNLESNKSICCVLVRNITFDNTSLVL